MEYIIYITQNKETKSLHLHQPNALVLFFYSDTTKHHTKLGNGCWVTENDGETINGNAKFIHNCDTL